MTKTERQYISLNKFRDAKGIGTIVACFRFGKTQLGVNAIDRVTGKNPMSNIIVLTPSSAVKDVWDKALGDRLSTISITLCTATTMINRMDRENIVCDILIIDEVHKFTSKEWYKVFNIKYKYLLCLTATFPVGERGDMIYRHAPIIDTISETEAVKNGWISNFIEFNIPITISDPYELKKYAVYSKEIKEIQELFAGIHKHYPELRPGYPLFASAYDLLQSCKSGKKIPKGYIQPLKLIADIAKRKGWSREMNLANDYNSQIDRYWNPDTIAENVQMFNDYVTKRNEIINYSEDKLKVILEIIKQNLVPTIIFNESTDFANRIVNELNDWSVDTLGKPIACAYHTKIPNAPLIDPDTNDYCRYKSGAKPGEVRMFGKDILRKAYLQAIREGKLLVVSTARALDEGIDVPNLAQVITSAGTTNPIQYQQRKARGRTVDIYNPEKLTKVFNLYIDNLIYEGQEIKSRDYTKLFYRQKESGASAIKVTNISEIFL